MENFTYKIKQENVDMETVQDEYCFESVEVGNCFMKEEILLSDESEKKEDSLKTKREGDEHEQGNENEHKQRDEDEHKEGNVDEHEETKTMEFTYVKVEENVDDNWTEPEGQEADLLALPRVETQSTEACSSTSQDTDVYKCNYAVTQPNDLKQQRGVQATTKLCKCTECDYASINSNNSEEWQHECATCKYVCIEYSDFKKHIRGHSRPYKCKWCEFAGQQECHLNTHIKLMHTKEKLHKCPDCDYVAIQQSYLEKHMITHTEEKLHKCPDCDYGTTETILLKKHMLIHTGPKRYSCTVCEYSALRYNELKKHKLIHTEEEDCKWYVTVLL